jgi:phenylacetate-CoA ligase
MIERRKLWKAAWDVWRTGRGGAPALAARQHARLADLIEFARTHSRFYGKLYSQLPGSHTDFRQLPPVTKPELMAAFEDWVTDPAVTRGSVEAFVADETLVGQPYQDRYAVWTSSGITGDPGLFVADSGALTVYWALAGVRAFRAWVRPRQLWEIRRRGGRRVADVVETARHPAEVALREINRRNRPWLPDRGRTVPVTLPMGDLVRALNEFQPTILVSYPTVLTVLAEEQAAGGLRIHPVLVISGGEWLPSTSRDQIAGTFGCLVRESYAASEFMGIGFDCGRGWLHLNSDWVILEPVNEVYQPVPPGQASHTALLTNLANRVQPIIRYDLGDSITLSPEPCPCGSALPALRVEGRRNEILSFKALDGKVIRIPPLGLTGVLWGLPEVRRSQLIQTGPATLRVRLEVTPGAHDQEVWEAVAGRLRGYLAAQGVASARVERASEPPNRDPISGRFRRVWSDLASVERQP